jgi:hypothetical protein
LSLLERGPGRAEVPTGCSSVTIACTITIPGNTLTPIAGPENGGLVEILGTDITSISWTISPGADVGFTVGTAVPEPDSLVLLATGLLAIALLKRTRIAVPIRRAT